jgi:hypothetical protein
MGRTICWAVPRNQQKRHHLRFTSSCGGNSDRRFFLKQIKGYSKGINVVVTDACHGDGRYFLRDRSNKNYVLSHGVSGVHWRFYKSPRPGPVFDIYMKYWGNVELEG